MSLQIINENNHELKNYIRDKRDLLELARNTIFIYRIRT